MCCFFILYRQGISRAYECIPATGYNNPQKIAATYMAIACRIYKTVLGDEDYEAMLKMIHETPIEPYNQPTLH